MLCCNKKYKGCNLININFYTIFHCVVIDFGFIWERGAYEFTKV